MPNMNIRLEHILEQIRKERERQFDLPGSEWDAKNTPGDWIALISHYVGKEVRKNGIDPLADDFEEALIKASAVIVAALQHIEDMKSRNQLL
jgi:hypothetical protein